MSDLTGVSQVDVVFESLLKACLICQGLILAAINELKLRGIDLFVTYEAHPKARNINSVKQLLP